MRCTVLSNPLSEDDPHFELEKAILICSWVLSARKTALISSIHLNSRVEMEVLAKGDKTTADRFDSFTTSKSLFGQATEGIIVKPHGVQYGQIVAVSSR